MDKAVNLMEILKTGIDFETRTIYFGNLDFTDGGIEFCPVQYVIRAIDKMVEQSDKPITLKLSSYGGSAYETLVLIDYILSSPVKFICYAAGAVFSAASWVLSVCDVRYLHKDTTLLIHDGSLAMGNEKTTDAEINVQENERLQRRLEQIFAENTLMPQTFWETVCRRDLFITADEAIKLGLADEIVPHKNRKEFRKQRKTQAQVISDKDLKALTKTLYKRIKIHTSPKV